MIVVLEVVNNCEIGCINAISEVFDSSKRASCPRISVYIRFGNENKTWQYHKAYDNTSGYFLWYLLLLLLNTEVDKNTSSSGFVK